MAHYLTLRLAPDTDWRTLEMTADRAGIILQDVGTIDPAIGDTLITVARSLRHDTVAMAHRDGVSLTGWAEQEPAVLEYETVEVIQPDPQQ